MEKYVYYSIAIFSVIIISLYLYLIVEKVKEKIINRRRNAYAKELIPLIDNIINEIIDGKNPDVLKERKLRNIIKNKLKKNIIEGRIIYYLENVKGNFAAALTAFCEDHKIVDKEIQELSKKNIYVKAMACKKLGEIRSKKAIPHLLKEIQSSAPDVTYNALLALSKTGDEEAFLKAFENLNSSILLSERSLIEIVDSFEGDKKQIYLKMMDSESEFISCVFIKSAGNFKDYSLSGKIAGFLKGDSKERKISAVKALGNMVDNRYTCEIAMQLRDESWEVRAVGAKALGRFEDSRVIPQLVEVLSDPQWFVRYNAADSLLALDSECIYIHQVLNGEDNFAKDIIIAAMENTGKIDQFLNGESSKEDIRRKIAFFIRNQMRGRGELVNE